MKKSVKTVSNPNPRALTHEILTAIRNRIKSGDPLLSRRSNYLLLDSHDIPKNTYLSWLRRGIVPIDSPHGMSLQEVVEKTRELAFLNRQKYILERGREDDLFRLSGLNLSTERRYIRQKGGIFTETRITTLVDPKRYGLALMASLKLELANK